MRRALAILFALISLAVLASAQDRQSGPEELRRKIAEGEECIVCGQSIVGREVVELRMAGRTFYVGSMML